MLTKEANEVSGHCEFQMIQVERVFAKLFRADVQEKTPEFEELKASIALKGVLNPITVYPVGDRFQLVSGSRRLGASIDLKKEWIPAKIVCPPEDEIAARILDLHENHHRLSLDPICVAEELKQIKLARGLSNNDLAKEVSMTPLEVCRALQLTELSDDLKSYVARRLMPSSTAVELNKRSEEERAQLLSQVLDGSITRDQLIGQRKATRQKKRSQTAENRPSRATAILGDGRTITVASDGLDFEGFVALLEELLNRARKIRPTGVALQTFIKMLRDQAAA